MVWVLLLIALQEVSEAERLTREGEKLLATGRFKEAQAKLAVALERARAGDDRRALLRAARALSNAQIHQGSYDQAERLLDEMLGLARQLSDRSEEAKTLNAIGRVWALRRDYARALEVWQDGLRAARAGRDGESEATLTINIGLAYNELGQYEQARRWMERGLALKQAQGDRLGMGRTLINLGSAFSQQRDYARALDHFSRALEILRPLDARYDIALARSFIGSCLAEVNQRERALEEHLEALKIYEQLGERSRVGLQLLLIGEIYLQLEDVARARDYLLRAREICRSLGIKTYLVIALDLLGKLYLKTGEIGRAREHYQQALGLAAEAKLPPYQFAILVGLSHVEVRAGKAQEAAHYAQRSLELAEKLAVPMQAQAYHAMGLAREAMGEWQAARRYFLQAIERIESLRARLAGEQMKAGFIATNMELYERALDLSRRLYRRSRRSDLLAECFGLAERYRGRALLDLLGEAQAEVRDKLGDEMRRREEQALREISSLQLALFTPRQSLSEAERQRVLQELRAAEDRFHEISRHIRLESPAYAQLRYPEPYGLERTQREALLEDELLLAFSLGENASLLWAVSRQEASMHELAGRHEIERAVQSYRLLIAAPPKGAAAFRRLRTSSEQLFKMLLGSASAAIEKSRRIIIIPDGILHYLPFESLMLPSGRYLIQERALSYIPSASVLGLLRRPALRQRHPASIKTKRMELFALGVSDYGRGGPPAAARSLYGGSGFDFASLPHIRTEVEAIATLFPNDRRKVCLDDAAGELAVKGEKLSGYRRLHFAAHGAIDQRNPSRSGIVLRAGGGEDGVLQMAEIFRLELDAELVVLSACQSGLGSLIKGEGLVGIQRAFLYAGAESVAVSLWSVNDQATAHLMRELYAGLKGGLSRSEALRRAKLAMLRSNITAYRCPYFWAPFVLVGLP